MNYNKQILYIFYNLILVIFTFRVESFTPVGRSSHSSILIGTKLYFFGGAISYNSSSNEVFYLDVSQTFNIASPPWTDLTISAKIPFGSSWTGMSSVDINNDPTIYLFGGIMRDPVSGNDTFIPIILSFNIKTLEWKIPYISGKIPEIKGIHAVSDNKGKLYIFCRVDNKLASTKLEQVLNFSNNMVILDTSHTTSLIWSYGSTLYAAKRSDDYSATILTNGVIVYIGGDYSSRSSIDNMIQISLYDTNLDKWSAMVAKNTSIIEHRFGHSAVLAPDGNIIIYGGENYLLSENYTLNFVNVEPDVAILNTQNTPFEWIVPTIPPSNVNNKPPSLSGHTADLVGNYMIVAFGRIVPTTLGILKLSSKIYIMDTRNYTWVDTFLPNDPNNPTQTPTQVLPPNSEDNKMKIITGVLGGALGIIFLSAIGFLGYKLHKKYKRKQIINIPGSI